MTRGIWAEEIYIALLSYFEKIAHMSVRVYVFLYIGMFVARANKVEGTMS